jgi:hypothetical protein
MKLAELPASANPERQPYVCAAGQCRSWNHPRYPDIFARCACGA